METPTPGDTTSFQATKWTLIREAREQPDKLKEIIAAYYPALRNYLHHLCRRFGLAEDRVEDLLHEFMVHTRCLAVPVERADPNRGRFRSLLRTSLYRLVIDRLRKERIGHPLAEDPIDDANPERDAMEDQAFDTSWAEAIARSAVEGVFRWSAAEPTRARVWNVFKARYLEPEPWSGPRITEVFGRDMIGNVDATARTARRKFQELVLAQLGRQVATPTGQSQDDAFRDFFEVIYRHDRLGEWRASDLPFLAPTREGFHSRLMGLPTHAEGVRLRELVAESAADLLLERWLARPITPEAPATTLTDLITQLPPSLPQLQLVKAFAKDRRYEAEQQAVSGIGGPEASGERLVGSEVATWLYFTAQALAVYYHHTRMTTIGDHELLEGVRWASEQIWGLPLLKPVLDAVAAGFHVR